MGQARDEAGNLWETDAQGNAVRLISQAGAPTQGGIYTLPQTPKQAIEVQAAQTNIYGNQIDNQVKGATANASIAKVLADARKAEADARVAEENAKRGGLTPDQFNEQRGKMTQLNSLASQINRVQQLYDQSVGKTKGLKGLMDYLPSDANAAFDAAGAALSQQGLGAFRVPGTGTVSDRDAMMFDRANLPTADTRDAAIQEQLRGLRARVEEEYRSRGLPAPDWVGQNAMDQVNVVGAQTQAMGAGSNANAVANLPPEAQAEYQAYLTQNAGRLDPNAYAQFRLGLAAKYGIQDDPARASIYAQEAASLNDYFAKGGRTFGTPTVDQPMTGVDRLRNAAVNNPFGAAIVGAADAGGFGAVSALAGDQMDALREANPISSVVGGAVGAVGATSALGKIGRRISQGLAPKLLQGGGRAQFGRNLATDATYGGIYGTATEGDPLTGAVVGGVASGLGQGIGSGLGRAVGGVDMAPAAAYLRGRGVDGMTTGQMMGGFAKRLEDKAMSIPGVGDMIGNRRLEGFQSFNRAAMNEAGAPIGATTSNYGEAGIADLLDQTGRAYDSATAGVTVPLDSQFTQGMAAARQAAGALPPDLAPRAMTAINNRVGPIAVAGDMTGDAYQQAIRGLKGYKAEATKPGFEADYRDTLTQAMDVLTAQMRRGGGSSVVEGLDRANAAYRGIKTLENAVSAAKNGTGSGQVQLFTPAQLNAAGYRAAAKYPGARPFADLADAGQEVLPSQVPDSGTAGRLLAAGLPVGLGGAAAGSEQFGLDNISKALGMAALLSAGASKTGQKAINKLLFDRPDAAKAAGTLIRKRKGLFGSASVPLMLEATQ